MTTSTTQGNYKDTHFQHADLTPIRGEPKNDTLKVLINECNANTQIVHPNLGGGANSHLGLVLVPPKYDIVAPGTPYNRPSFPGPLTIPSNTTNVQAQMLREQHQEDIRVFHEREVVHNALVQQVVKAIKPMSLNSLRNPVTQEFLVPLNKIIQQLLTVYGGLNPEKFMTTKNVLEHFQYQLSLPVDVVFDLINDLIKLANVAGQP